MKQLFKLVDKLMELLTELPSKLQSDDDVNKSKSILKGVEKYVWKIEKLIHTHKLEEHLTKLHNSHLEDIPDWADHISKVFAKLDHLMRILNEDIPKLRTVLDIRRTNQRSLTQNEWTDKIQDFSMGMWMTGLHDTEKELDHFRNLKFSKKNI